MTNFDKFLDSKRALKEMFREFDRDGNGFINKEEAKNVVEKLFPDGEDSLFTKEEMADFWTDFNDFDKDGLINYEEFLIWYETSRMNGVLK